jgi:hypothetical protein
MNLLPSCQRLGDAPVPITMTPLDRLRVPAWRSFFLSGVGRPPLRSALPEFGAAIRRLPGHLVAGLAGLAVSTAGLAIGPAVSRFSRLANWPVNGW